MRVPLPQLVLVLVSATPTALTGQASPDGFAHFTSECSDVFAESSMIDRPGAERLCACVARESRTAGVPADDMAQVAAAMREDPKYVVPDGPIKSAATSCAREAMEEFKRVQNASRTAEVARRNQAPDAAVRIEWTGYWLGSEGTETLSLQDGSDTTVPVADGVACTIGGARQSETTESELVMTTMARTVSCPGLDVAVEGRGYEGTTVRCSHSRDGKSSTGGQTHFTVSRAGADEPLGTIMLLCYMSQDN